MFRKSIFALVLLSVSAFAISAQNDLKIRKSIKMKVPGMESMMASMPKPPGGADPFSSTQNIFIKGSSSRTEMTYKKHAGFGKMTTKKSVIINRCDLGRTITYNDDKRKFFVDDEKADPKTKKGGYVKITIEVTDTGERMKLFGYDARHIKQKITMVPGPNACMKESMALNIDGWYADIPTYACSVKPDVSEMQYSRDCYDDIVFEMKGATVKGYPVKEIKTMVLDGQEIVTHEEITSLERTTLLDSLFEPPPNYTAGNSKAELYNGDDSGSAAPPSYTPPPATVTVPSTSTLAPPKAGMEPVTVGPKQPGMIRIGVAKPKVTTPETKNDPLAGQDVADAAAASFVEGLKADGIEAVLLNTDFPENECAERQCDYVLHSTVVQKRGGGGMFGKMIAMSAVSVAGAFIPGIGGMVASTVASQVMGNVMMKSAKAKDEFALDYKLADMNKSIIATAAAKKKTEKDGEDILTPMIGEASKTLLAKVRKP